MDTLLLQTRVELKLYCDKGSTFYKKITIKHRSAETGDYEPTDLTGLTASMRVAKREGTAPIIELTTDNEMIELGGADGTITLKIPPSTTTSFEQFTYKYVIEIADEFDVSRVIFGQFEVAAEFA